MDTEPSLLTRARLHAALGEPARLAIVDALRLGDASPGEIAKLLELPTNLVAHHLNILDEVGLVRRSRSEGDGRKVYLRLVPAALTGLTPPPLTPVPRVLFVCTHNSARSQLAAALWATRTDVPARSAGTRPAANIHPRTARIARRHGLALSRAKTAHINDVLRRDDLVIAVCDNAHEQLSTTGRPRLHWSVPDPVPADTDAAFETAYAELTERIERLAAALNLRPTGRD
jgi:protein-tyrosine-phosphatase